MTMRVTLSRPPAQVDFEVGSISEAVGILQSEESALVQLFTIADKMNGSGEEAEQAASEAPKKERKTRTPKEAVAPPPMPVPSAAAPPSPPVPPSLAIPADGGIPAFLDRSGGASAGQPLPPTPPPLAPAAPNFALGNRVADVLEAKAATAADAGKSLVTWLQHPGLGGIVRNDPSVTFQEAVAVVRMTTDDRVAIAAGLLQVS